MKSKAIAIGLVLVLLAVYLSGCIESDKVSGTYRCETNEDVLYLQKGEYDIVDDIGGGAFGSYKVVDDMVLLRLEFLGIIRPMAIEGRDLIDPDGDLWVRD